MNIFMMSIFVNKEKNYIIQLFINEKLQLVNTCKYINMAN